MGLLFQKKGTNKNKEKSSNSFLKYAVPIGIGLYAKSKRDKKKAEEARKPKGEKVLGGLFRKKVKDPNEILGGQFRKTGKGIFKKK